MIQIKHRYTGDVIKEVAAASLVNVDLRATNLRAADLQDANLLGANLRGADLRGAYLRDAYLRYADLRDANLQDTNLQGANLKQAELQRANLLGADLCSTNIRWVLGDGKRIKTIIDQYMIVIMLEYGVMAIGCEQHNIDKWMNFSDKEIDKMYTDALHWWKVWKPRIQQLIVN
jgi:hypothetical protein